jgi:hypothetical protein
MNQTSPTNPIFRISVESLQERRRNLLWGLVLSLLMVAVIEFGYYQDPDRYNEALRFSVILFVVLANGINYHRHRRYLRQVQDHRVEVHPGRVQFWTGGAMTELDLKDVVLMHLYRRRRSGILRHIQLRLKNHRGIRLEGYEDLEGLASALGAQIPKAHIVQRSA